jgi:hypothetical protein
MKNLMTALVLSCAAFTAPSFAADKAAPAASAPMAAGGCEAQAMDKKLSGAAKNSFVTKCEKDTGGAAKAACDSQAAEKKLSGAAKNSFVKKCVTDAGKA